MSARTRHNHNRRLANRMMQQHIAGEEPQRSPTKRPIRRTQVYRAPAFHSEHRPMKPLRDHWEEVWRLNLIQYYRGWIRHRPTPRGVGASRAREIRSKVYNLIPEHLKPAPLRRINF